MPRMATTAGKPRPNLSDILDRLRPKTVVGAGGVESRVQAEQLYELVSVWVGTPPPRSLCLHSADSGAPTGSLSLGRPAVGAAEGVPRSCPMHAFFPRPPTPQIRERKDRSREEGQYQPASAPPPPLRPAGTPSTEDPFGASYFDT